MIARFVLGAGAIFAVAGLAGCGAETGQGTAEGVGSSAEALTSAAASAYTLPAGRQALASCTLLDVNNNPLILAFGGFDNTTPVPQADIYVHDLASNWYAAQDSGAATLTLTKARGNLRAIRDPNDAHSCFIVGGSTTINGNAFVKSGTNFNVEKITAIASGKFSLSTAYAQLAVSNFELRSCGKVIIAFGGKTNNSISNMVKYLDTSSTANTWQSVTMGVERYDLGVAQDTFTQTVDGSPVTRDVFVIGGGATSGNRDATIDLLKATNADCTAWSIGTNAVISGLTGREGNVVVRDPDNLHSKYVVAAGQISGTAAVATADTFTVTWSNTPPTAGTASSTTALAAATYHPIYLQKNSLTRDFVIGGKDASATPGTFTTNAVQATKASQTPVLWDTVPKNLPTVGRVLGAAEEVSGLVYVFGGIDTVGPSLPTATIVVTP